MPVFHQESFGDCAEEGEAEAFVEVAGVGVGFYYRVELHYAEVVFSCFFEAVFDEFFADVETS